MFDDDNDFARYEYEVLSERYLKERKKLTSKLNKQQGGCYEHSYSIPEGELLGQVPKFA